MHRIGFGVNINRKYRKGVAGWWGDLGEPETHPASMYHNLKDLGFKRLFKADEVHNIYGHYWDKMLFDKYAKEYPRVYAYSILTGVDMPEARDIVFFHGVEMLAETGMA